MIPGGQPVECHAAKFEWISEIFTFSSKAMFTLYRIGFCSIAKVAPVPVQREQELIFSWGAKIVPKHSQCEQKPCSSYNLQRCLLI